MCTINQKVVKFYIYIFKILLKAIQVIEKFNLCASLNEIAGKRVSLIGLTLFKINGYVLFIPKENTELKNE